MYQYHNLTKPSPAHIAQVCLPSSSAFNHFLFCVHSVRYETDIETISLELITYYYYNLLLFFNILGNADKENNDGKLKIEAEA